MCSSHREPELIPYISDIPRTVEEACAPTLESRVMTGSTPPFLLVDVNLSWCRMTGYEPEEVIGGTLALLHGHGTCRKTLDNLRQQVLEKRTFMVRLINYTKDGRPFLNTMLLAPLVDADGVSSLYLGESTSSCLDNVPPVVPSTPAAPPRSLSAPLMPSRPEAAPRSPSAPPEFRARVPPFLLKLIDIVTSDTIKEPVVYRPESCAFFISDPNKFSKEVRPRQSTNLLSQCPATP